MVLVCDLQPRTLYSAHGNMRLNKVTIIKGNAEMAAGLLSKSLDAGYKHWEHKEFLIFFALLALNQTHLVSLKAMSSFHTSNNYF